MASTKKSGFIELFFKTDDVRQIREWLAEHLPEVPDDFSQSWRDGILFCKLLNKLQAGCYPDANRLDTNFGVRNLSKAFRILETRFDIIPKVTVEEIVTCSKDSEPKLVNLLLQLKQKTDDNENNEIKPATEEVEKVQENGATEAENCLAKGTGLLVGFVGRSASFGVFFSSLSDLNLVVEIKGPSNTICCERVTKRSPKKKNIIKPWKPLSPLAVTRSCSNEENEISNINVNQDLPTDTEKCFIPLEYEIHSNQISFTYFPLIQGEHRIAVLSHGQHVSDSPYLLNVEPSVRGHKIESMAHIKSVLKPPRCCQKSEEDPKNSSVRFQEPSERKERLGKILKRQVLRYIVKIDGKDVVVDSDCIDNLATSLLKMDYELQKRPLIRRNSWGFVGDAERKISVIRQFGIDLDELESQSIKMQRSHSLSLSPIIKKPRKISSSYECEDINQQTILETVAEGRVSYFNNSSTSYQEEDDVFALVNEDFDHHSDVETKRIFAELGNFDSNSLNDLRDLNPSENSFRDRNVKEVDKSFSTRQEKTRLKFEVSNTRSLISSDEVPENHLTSTKECSSRLDVQTSEEGEQKMEIKSEIILSDANQNSEITQLLYNQSDYMSIVKNTKDHNLVEVKKTIEVVKNGIEEFKNSESANRESAFVEEIPCTKTNAKNVSNSASQKNMFDLSDPTKAELSKYENLKYLSNKEILHSNCGNIMSQTKEINNSIKNCQCKVLKKTTTYKGNVDSLVKSKHFLNEQLKFKNMDMPKIGSKSIVFSNVKKNKTRGQRLHKYQHLGKKVQTNTDSYYTKRRRSSSKSAIEDSMVKKLQCIMKNVNNNTLSHMASFKSTKKRTVSDPTYNSFKRDENRKSLNYNRKENALPEANYENKENNFKRMSNSSFKGAINISKHLSNMCSKINMNRNEYEAKFWPETSKASTEFMNLPQHLRENFNISPHPKNNNVINEYSMIYESFSASDMDSTPNQSRESFGKSSYGNSTESSRINDSTSKNTCHFTYKHFNPSFKIDRESTVKRQIKLWETSTIQKNYKPISKHIDTLHVLPELVDIKSKLKFWENAYHHSENEELKDTNIFKNADDTCKKEERIDTAKSISSGINLEGNAEKQNQVPLESTHKTNINNINSSEKSVDNKMLNMDSTKAKTRSFSDPGVLDKPNNVLDDDELHLGYRNATVNPSSSKDEMSSSNDGNFIELFADDEESSMELLCSTEDEYIDDEISENISTYWGDLTLMKGLNVYDSSEYEEFLQLMNSESLQSCADECKFFGIATYFGHVAVKNRFWVLTKDAGRGNLSASVQGIGQHNVAFVSVEYTRKDIYEVIYQVFTPGLYLISARWMDSPIPGSPFLCKVTF
ncbi:unnamed protein product [Larinioides sclopetarius]|uniref:Calponin-homology (CH) domain-containing protein n=1 Tax=Larinioides sclopetarius TaxID=280406 RepID=A0AAV1YXT6_9ARAC